MTEESNYKSRLEKFTQNENQINELAAITRTYRGETYVQKSKLVLKENTWDVTLTNSAVYIYTAKDGTVYECKSSWQIEQIIDIYINPNTVFNSQAFAIFDSGGTIQVSPYLILDGKIYGIDIKKDLVETNAWIATPDLDLLSEYHFLRRDMDDLTGEFPASFKKLVQRYQELLSGTQEAKNG